MSVAGDAGVGRRRARPVRLAGGLLLVLLLGGGGAGCGRGAASRHAGAPVVLVSIDTLRSDRLPAYGYRGVATPAIDALRRDSLLYRRAYSNVPLTVPSHASILSGELPSVHGVRDNGGYVFRQQGSPTLASLLRQAGYATGGAVSFVALGRSSGLDVGFDSFDAPGDVFDPATAGNAERPGGVTVDRAISWLRGVGERPFFLFVHLYEPHAPYAPPEPFASRYADRYDGEIAAADAVVGTLIAELRRRGLYDGSLVILLSDHGEGLGDHGEQGHGVLLYREALQVPLLVKLPHGERAGEVVDEPAQLVDVYPTVLSLLGLALPAAGRGAGASLLAPSPEGLRSIHAETYFPRIQLGWSELQSLIRGRHHYQQGTRGELFDLVADPGERHDLAASERRIAATSRQELQRLDGAFRPPGALTPETAEKLASLGYVGAPVSAQGARPDPRDRRDSLRLLEEGLDLWRQGAAAPAAARFRQLVDAEPQMVGGWSYLAHALADLGDHAGALAAYQRALPLSGGSATFALGAARELFALRRYDEARGHVELALSAHAEQATELLARIDLAQGDLEAAGRRLGTAGGSEAVRRQVGELLLAAGRADEAVAALSPLSGSREVATLDALAAALVGAEREEEALAVLQRTLAIAPDHARAYETLGVVRLRGEQPELARQLLEKALQLDPALPVAWNTLGVARYRLGDATGALAAWQRAVELDSGQFDALFNLGLVAAEAGRRDQARAALRRFVATAPPAQFAADIAKARQWLGRLG